MFTFKPLGYRVLIEYIGKRNFPSVIQLPDGSEMDGMDRWVIRELGDGAPSALTGNVLKITSLNVGDEIVFDHKRAAEIVPPFMNGGKRFAFVDVEAIHGTISGEPEPAPPTIVTAKSIPSLAA